jgi:hypothetical protein
MFKLTSLFRLGGHTEPDRSAADEPPAELVVGASVFDLSRHLAYREGYPTLDWEVVQSWVNSFETEALQGQVWSAAEKAWLLHMRESLGQAFELAESSNAMLLSSLEPNVARSTLDYMERNRLRVLQAVAEHGHLRCADLAAACRPGAKYGKQMAQRRCPCAAWSRRAS